jgi:hypothetical protein
MVAFTTLDRRGRRLSYDGGYVCGQASVWCWASPGVSMWRGGGRILFPRGTATDERKESGRVTESVDLSTFLPTTWMMHA